MAADRITGKTFACRSLVMAPHGMVASSHPLATQIGLDILKIGGNAVDSAIATNAALGLMEPTGSGIGGDLFALVWETKNNMLHGLNASGRSPQTLSLRWFKDNGFMSIPSRGPLSVSVPGAVDGWFELSHRFGNLAMSQLLQPTIEYARNGHPVHQVIQHEWESSVNALSGFPGFVKQMTIDGRAPAIGEMWRNPNLADTLQRIGEEGRDVFYKGDIAKSIGKYMHDNGGFLSCQDMANHVSEWVRPLSVNYRGHDVWELPPNGQGIAALQILNLLEPYDITAMGFGSADYLHVLIEAKKIAYQDRARFYADPDFAEIPLEQLLSREYAAQRGRLLNMRTAAMNYPPGDPAALRHGDTVYLTTADADGNMVSLIQSNYRGMGSGMTPPGLGFVLQNRGELFSLDGGHANAFAPGKRPFHTIIPAFITKNDEPWLSFGVMGGDMQPQGHVQIITNLLDFGMNLQEAGDAPRVHHFGSSGPTGETMHNGGIVNLENGFDYRVIRDLMSRGHTIQHALGPYGGYQAIMKDSINRVYQGASESRKDGQAAGY